MENYDSFVNVLANGQVAVRIIYVNVLYRFFNIAPVSGLSRELVSTMEEVFLLMLNDILTMLLTYLKSVS